MGTFVYFLFVVQLYSIKCQKNVVLIIADDFRYVKGEDMK